MEGEKDEGYIELNDDIEIDEAASPGAEPERIEEDEKEEIGLPTDISSWSIEDVIEHLSQDKILSKTTEWRKMFWLHHVTGDVLLSLNAIDIKEELHISSYGIRTKILTIVDNLRGGQAQMHRDESKQYDKDEKLMFFRDAPIQQRSGYGYASCQNRFVMYSLSILSAIAALLLISSGAQCLRFPMCTFARGYAIGIVISGAIITIGAFLALHQTSTQEFTDRYQTLAIGYAGLIGVTVYLLVMKVQTCYLCTMKDVFQRDVGDLVSRAVLYMMMICAARYSWQQCYGTNWSGHKIAAQNRSNLLTSLEFLAFVFATFVCSVCALDIADGYTNTEVRVYFGISGAILISSVISYLSVRSTIWGHLPLSLCFLALPAATIYYVVEKNMANADNVQNAYESLNTLADVLFQVSLSIAIGYKPLQTPREDSNASSYVEENND